MGPHALGVLQCEVNCCRSILAVISHVTAPHSGDVNGGRNENNISRKLPPMDQTMAVSVNVSFLWFSYGATVLNLLFQMHPTLNVK